VASEDSISIVVNFPDGWFDRVERLMRKMNRVSRKRRKVLKAKLDRLVLEPKIEAKRGA